MNSVTPSSSLEAWKRAATRDKMRVLFFSAVASLLFFFQLINSSLLGLLSAAAVIVIGVYGFIDAGKAAKASEASLKEMLKEDRRARTFRGEVDDYVTPIVRAGAASQFPFKATLRYRLLFPVLVLTSLLVFYTITLPEISRNRCLSQVAKLSGHAFYPRHKVAKRIRHCLQQ